MENAVRVRAVLREKRGVTEFSSPRHLPDFGGQNTKKKNVLSISKENHPRENTKKQETFFLFGVAECSEAVAGRFVERTKNFHITRRVERAHYLLML
jgi:hypothetical protein